MQRLTAPLPITSLLLTLLGLTFVSLVTPAARADSADDLHAQLKERWYTTELVVFRYTNPPSAESLLFAGERLNAEAYAKQRLAADEATISVLTLGDSPENVAREQRREERPALDVAPARAIQDYGSSTDLGALVAQNMATWENQLRQQDGELLSSEQLTLTEQVAKLQSNRSIEVLLHSGWTQAVPARDNGEPVTLTGGDTYVDPRNGDRRSRLEGEVTVTLGRYLHVQPTLYYTPVESSETALPAQSPQTSNNPTAIRGIPEVEELSSGSALDRLRDRRARRDQADANQADRSNFAVELPPYSRLEQSRRVRSGELHYIDHPELGVLVKVLPVVAPELLQEQFTLLQ